MSTKKYIVNLSIPLLSMKGEPIDPPITVGQLIGDRIGAASSDKHVIKLNGWALSMVKGEPLTLDSEDFNSLKAFIEILPGPTPFQPGTPIYIKAQAIECFNTAAVEKKE
jgi:hypothetical protein